MKKRVLMFFSTLMAIALLAIQGAAASNNITLKIICANTGKVIYTPPESTQYAYRYGPAILIDGDRIDIWASAPPLISNGVRYGNDSIEYIRSEDGGKTWTEWKTVLYPTLNSEDKWSTCDPGAFKYGDYYYVGYTGSPEFRTNPDKDPEVNNLFIARAKNPEGPYEKWNGSGWGGNPYAITRYSGDGVGCSMPSFTVKGDKLYMYYVDQTEDHQDWNSYGNISVSVFPLTDPNWPGKLISNNRCTNEPEEVRYCPSIGKFIGFQLKGGWDYDSYVGVFESTDGVKFTKTSSFRNNFPNYSHNIGVSGNNLGQLDLNVQNYIGTAYTPTGDQAWWGHWHTKFIPLYIKQQSSTSSSTSANASVSSKTQNKPSSKPSEGTVTNPSSTESLVESAMESLLESENIQSTQSVQEELSSASVVNEPDEQKSGVSVWVYIAIAAAIILLAGGGIAVYFLVIKKKRI